MTTKHTPGPWQHKANISSVSVFDASGGILARLPANRFPPVQATADARLIAAAPTLLEVLQELEESSGYWSEYDVPLGIVERIKDAIALATGTTA